MAQPEADFLGRISEIWRTVENDSRNSACAATDHCLEGLDERHADLTGVGCFDLSVLAWRVACGGESVETLGVSGCGDPVCEERRSEHRVSGQRRRAFDLVFVPGYVTHLELHWDMPSFVPVLERLGSFSRLIRFDKRGTGMSDRVSGAPTLESRMDDVRAVMDAVGSRRAAFYGLSEGAAMALLFAATYPDRRRRSSCAAPFRAGCGRRTIRGAGRRRSMSVRSPGRSRSLVRAGERGVDSPLGRFEDDEAEPFLQLLRYGSSPACSRRFTE